MHVFFFENYLLVLQNTDWERELHKHCVSITCTSCKGHNPSGLESVVTDTLQVAFHQLLLNL